MDVQAAARAYDELDPEAQAEARRLIGQGRDRVQVVKGLHQQRLERQGVAAEKEAEGSTAGEDVASFAMTAADTLAPSPLALAMSGPYGMLSAGAIEGARRMCLDVIRKTIGFDEALRVLAKRIADNPIPAPATNGKARHTINENSETKQ